LQQEFLRVQAEVRKTILFVTHDIEEAVRLGDRIAVFRQGGILEQYDTPAQVLGAPANDFVAGFVGADRGLRRLDVTLVSAADIEQPPVVDVRGHVFPCIYLVGIKRFSMGNMMNGTYPNRALLKRMYDRLHVDRMAECASCPWRYLCGGGCPLWRLTVSEPRTQRAFSVIQITDRSAR